MVKIVISQKPSKCNKCQSTTFKIEYSHGPDPDKFLLTINELMCAKCGHIFLGELSDHKKEEIEVTEENYKKMLEQHKEFKSKGYISSS